MQEPDEALQRHDAAEAGRAGLHENAPGEAALLAAARDVAALGDELCAAMPGLRRDPDQAQPPDDGGRGFGFVRGGCVSAEALLQLQASPTPYTLFPPNACLRHASSGSGR